MTLRSAIIAIHRDAGYFLAGVLVVYGVSGLALNHADHWNPSWIITRRVVALALPERPAEISTDRVRGIVERAGEAGTYLSHDFPTEGRIKIYLRDGSITGRLGDADGELETIRRRPFLFTANALHVAPRCWWRWFSDAVAVGLIVLALSGFLLKRGRNGLTGRAGWLCGGGVAVTIAASFLV